MSRRAPAGSPPNRNAFAGMSLTANRYDRMDIGYARRRRPDPRIARMIVSALGDAESVVNVGAGTGSAEPADRLVVAVEPVTTMIRQRGPRSAPVVQASALALPFADDIFNAGLAVLTIHHWPDWVTGLGELVRVTRERVVLFTWDPGSDAFWLATEYFPDLLECDRKRFPGLDALDGVLGPIEIIPVPIPHDCSDGFMGAYWRRPEAYLDPDVRRGISSFSNETSSSWLGRLAEDIESGAWARKHGDLLQMKELDIGYRLVIASSASAKRAGGWPS
jgi:SAM-dependent methyltransferase